MNTIAVQHVSNKPDLVKIEWNLGKRCNFQCSYCGDHNRDNFSPHMSFEVAKNTIDIITSKLSNRRIRIAITGGEPTINPNFVKILEYLEQSNVEVSLTTNGSRSEDFYISIAPLLWNINFSYHMEYHRKYDVPEKIIAMAKEMGRLGKNQPKVHLMALPGEFQEIENVSDQLGSHGIGVVKRRIRPSYIKDHPDSKFDDQGRLIHGVIAQPHFKGVVTLKFKNGEVDFDYTDTYYSDEEEKIFLDEKVSNFNNIMLYQEDGTVIEDNVNDLMARKENKYLGWLCWAGRESLRIQSNGDVFVATCRAIKLGNIYESFTIPEEPIVCPLNWCACAADLNTTKVKSKEYIKNLRNYNE